MANIVITPEQLQMLQIAYGHSCTLTDSCARLTSGNVSHKAAMLRSLTSEQHEILRTLADQLIFNRHE